MKSACKTIGFIPLDTRPCTYDFPVQLARQAGAEVMLPPAGLMAHYKTGSDIHALARWIEKAAPQCDAFVISVEQLLHGGLIQSRQAAAGLDRLLERLQTIRLIKDRTPGLVIYLSNVIMRTSISTLDPETLVWWEKINRYSTLSYREKADNDRSAARQCRALEQEIPAKILQTFFEARRINHEINCACVRLAADGVADTLYLLQEDCSPESLQRFEHDILIQDITARDLSRKVFMFNGTDEAGAELMQKAISPAGCELEVVWIGKTSDFVAKYEDRPFRENLAGHLDALSIREVKDAPRVLLILTPNGAQREASLSEADVRRDYTSDELMAYCRIIESYVRQGRSCYLLDLDFANGGNTKLLEILSRVLPVRQLCGYAAWNTASNALGTVLAQILASQTKNDAVNRAFTAERILDDAIYQSIVRQVAAKRLTACGEDIYNIQDRARAEHCLQDAFNAVRPLTEVIFAGHLPDFKVRLRWPRLFEAAIFTQTGGGPVYNEDPTV